jgi:phosphonate transport system substrate-binding protein
MQIVLLKDNFMKFRLLGYSFFLFLGLLGCDSSNSSKDKIITKSEEEPVLKVKSQRKLNFYFTPSMRTQLMKESANTIAKALEAETGILINAVIPDSYNTLIADFDNDKADFAIMNTLSYVVANKKSNVNAKLKSIKYGKSTYKGQIIANAKSGIETLEDINGKKFIYTSKTSTSGFFYPAMLLKSNNIKPKSFDFALKHDFVVESVYRGLSDAGATFYSEPSETGEIRDARAILKSKYPDIEEKVKIIALTEPIPNDPVVFNKNVDEETVNIICDALQKYAQTTEGSRLLIKIYGTEGFIKCSDEDYKGIMLAVGESEYDLNELD